MNAHRESFVPLPSSGEERTSNGNGGRPKVITIIGIINLENLNQFCLSRQTEFLADSAAVLEWNGFSDNDLSAGGDKRGDGVMR